MKRLAHRHSEPLRDEEISSMDPNFDFDSLPQYLVYGALGVILLSVTILTTIQIVCLRMSIAICGIQQRGFCYCGLVLLLSLIVGSCFSISGHLFIGDGSTVATAILGLIGTVVTMAILLNTGMFRALLAYLVQSLSAALCSVIYLALLIFAITILAPPQLYEDLAAQYVERDAVQVNDKLETVSAVSQSDSSEEGPSDNAVDRLDDLLRSLNLPSLSPSGNTHDGSETSLTSGPKEQSHSGRAPGWKELPKNLGSGPFGFENAVKTNPYSEGAAEKNAAKKEWSW